MKRYFIFDIEKIFNKKYIIFYILLFFVLMWFIQFKYLYFFVGIISLCLTYIFNKKIKFIYILVFSVIVYLTYFSILYIKSKLVFYHASVSLEYYIYWLRNNLRIFPFIFLISFITNKVLFLGMNRDKRILQIEKIKFFIERAKKVSVKNYILIFCFIFLILVFFSCIKNYKNSHLSNKDIKRLEKSIHVYSLKQKDRNKNLENSWILAKYNPDAYLDIYFKVILENYQFEKMLRYNRNKVPDMRKLISSYIDKYMKRYEKLIEKEPKYTSTAAQRVYERVRLDIHPKKYQDIYLKYIDKSYNQYEYLYQTSGDINILKVQRSILYDLSYTVFNGKKIPEKYIIAANKNFERLSNIYIKQEDISELINCIDDYNSRFLNKNKLYDKLIDKYEHSQDFRTSTLYLAELMLHFSRTIYFDKENTTYHYEIIRYLNKYLKSVDYKLSKNHIYFLMQEFPLLSTRNLLKQIDEAYITIINNLIEKNSISKEVIYEERKNVDIIFGYYKKIIKIYEEHNNKEKANETFDEASNLCNSYISINENVEDIDKRISSLQNIKYFQNKYKFCKQ